MSEEWQIDLVCCTDVICNEVKQGLPQRDIAVSYALAIRSAARGVDKPDWSVINGAILSRWKMSGLERIKKRAFDLLYGKDQP